MSKIRAKYWTCERDAERFHCETVDAAVEEYLDDREPEDWPIKLIAYGYTPIELAPGSISFRYELEQFLEQLDEEYGDPDETTEITDAMLVAAEAFGEIIRKLYPVFSCERVEESHVDVQEWVLHHHPGWPIPEAWRVSSV